MANTDQIHSFIRLVMNENLAQAQSVIQEALNAKLSAALDEKFEAYAPAIFEALDLPGKESPDGDIDNDGKNMTKRDRYLLSRRKVRAAAINEGEEGGEEYEDGEEEYEDGEEEVDEQETDEGDEQQMQRYSAPTSGSATSESDGY